MRLEREGATATILGDITAAIIGSIITTTIMGMGRTGLTTGTVTGLITIIMVVTAMTIPTGAAPASVSGSAFRTKRRLEIEDPHQSDLPSHHETADEQAY
jgi:hypothetical protein